MVPDGRREASFLHEPSHSRFGFHPRSRVLSMRPAREGSLFPARGGACFALGESSHSRVLHMDYDKESVELHAQLHGKLGVRSKVSLASKHDLSLAYTPG